MTFDPYYRWLGIRPKDQPPNHYRLLGVDLFEYEEDIIEAAADQRMLLLRSFQTGPNSKAAEQLLNEIAAAKVCLLDPEARHAYNQALDVPMWAKQVEAKPTAPPVEPARDVRIVRTNHRKPQAAGSAGAIGLVLLILAGFAAALYLGDEDTKLRDDPVWDPAVDWEPPKLLPLDVLKSLARERPVEAPPVEWLPVVEPELPAEAPPFAGKVVDLLALIDPAKHAESGWVREGEEVVCPVGGVPTLMLPYEFPEQYKLTAVVSQTRGRWTVANLAVVSPPQSWLFAFNASYPESTQDQRGGVLQLKGYKWPLGPTVSPRAFFSGKKPSTIVAYVDPDGVVIHFDGELIIDWQRGFEALETPKNLEPVGLRFFAHCGLRIHKLELVADGD